MRATSPAQARLQPPLVHGLELPMTSSPMPNSETILAELPGASETERVLLVHKTHGKPHGLDRETEVELRQQSWAPGIGWFTQSSVHLSPEQVGGLRMALGASARPPHAGASIPFRTPRDMARPGTSAAGARASERPFVPRVVHAETA